MKTQKLTNSLLITPKLCEEYKACTKGINFMKKKHPNGFTVAQVYNKEVRGVPKFFMHWGKEYLPFTDEDREMYYEHMKIINSESVFGSNNVENSSVVKGSSFIENSSYILNSSNVKDSYEIINSKNIKSSENLMDSFDVIDSKTVYFSSDIKNCNGIYSSKTIRDSHSIAESFNIKNCSFISKSNDLDNCHLCKNINNSNNRIFCHNWNDEHIEYAIFNKEVDKTTYYYCLNILTESSMLTNFSHPSGAKEFFLENTFKESLIYWQEIKDNFPFFDADIAYEITLLKELYDLV